jgi:nucleotide-binding universal stress UspA family protein
MAPSGGFAMRVLLAIDGSQSADRARDLVAALPWPRDSHIRIVAVLEHRGQLYGAPWIAVTATDADQLEQQAIYTVDTALDAAERDIARPGRRVERILLRGRPASEIVDEARAFEPDLLVVGSRGHGPIQSMLLGSVSAEIVDHAPCPVLVVRDAPLRAIVLAEDGSESARSAADVLEAWPVFRGLPLTVLSVAETRLPTAAGMTPGLYDEVLTSYAESVDEAIRQAEAMASTTAERLGKVGFAARSAFREGDAAHEIVEYAKVHEAGLVVVGTRGHTGIARLLLGSVARNVLLHAPCSVLVVRRGVAARREGGGEGEAAAEEPGGERGGAGRDEPVATARMAGFRTIGAPH